MKYSHINNHNHNHNHKRTNRFVIRNYSHVLLQPIEKQTIKRLCPFFFI